MHLSPVRIITTAMAGVFALTGLGISPASQAVSSKPSAKTVATGKALVTKYRCNSCHGADLAGRPGKVPSIKSTGVLKEYTPKTWVRLFTNGTTNDGKPVGMPMSSFKLKPADSTAIWAYLETVK
jgi:mono/diheme cytochrome c family protein